MRRLFIIFLVLFFLGSLLFISPKVRSARSSIHSSQLKKVITKEGNIEKTDYVDDNGEITIAADLGYATMIVTRTEHGILEQYYDAKGEPISRYSGYYAVLREYDDAGYNVCNTYLDIQLAPFVMASGYAIEKRVHNENGQVVAIRYFDSEGLPIFTTAYAYGKNNEFDENGMVHRVIYVDAEGDPMITGKGYAIVSYNRYLTEGPEYGKVESEFYYDSKGRPVSLSLGQYGLHKEYDNEGRETVWTFLDTSGKPIVTNMGYTTIRRTFYPDNSVETERYYDLDGNPFPLSEGQYGIKRKGGQTIYLNRDGEEKINFKALVYNQSWLSIAFTLIIMILSMLFDRKGNIILLIGYMGIIIYFTLMYRESSYPNVNFELFWSYRKIFTDSSTRADILRNIWLFIPLGIILYRNFSKIWILFLIIAFSIIIEAIQYITGRGLCELDDVVSNSLGGVVGYLVCQKLGNPISKIIKKMQFFSKNNSASKRNTL